MKTFLLKKSGTISKAKLLLTNKWFLLLMNTLFFIMMAIVLPIHFETDDDVTMCQIANGRFSGNTDAHLVFINAILGWLISSLYRVTRVVEWYTLVLCIFHVLAFSGIIYFVINDIRIHRVLKFVFILFVYTLWIRIIVGFQFTTTAGALCCCGCMALLRPSKKCKALGVMSVFIASLVRFQVAGLVGLLFIPFFVADFLQNKKFAFWLSITFLVVLMGKRGDSFFYRSSEWIDYKEYNSLRGGVLDDSKSSKALQYMPNGIQIDDFELFVKFEGDPKVITTEKLRLVKEAMQEEDIRQSLSSNLYGMIRYRVPLFFIFLGFFSGIYINVKQKREKWTWVLLCELGLFAVTLFYMCVMWNVKERVFFVMLMPSIYILVRALPERMNHGRILITCVMLGLVFKYIYQDYKMFGSVHDGKRYVEDYQIPLVIMRKEKVFSIEFWEQYLPPFGIKDLNYQVRGLGWSALSPLNKGILESHLDLVNPNWAIFTQVDDPPVDIAKAIERNYGVKVDVVCVDNNEKYALYKLVKQ